MANALTGDFDVVAEFTLQAVNRVLAAMHAGNRFPHSWSLRVDDAAQGIRKFVGAVDAFGDPVTSPVMNTQKRVPPGRFDGSSSHSTTFQIVDPIVNAVAPGTGLTTPDRLTGFAQVQFGPPTMAVPDDSGKTVITTTPTMIRYFPDDGSMVLPEFLRGELQLTMQGDEVMSQAGTYIDVGLVGPYGQIQYTNQWSNTPLNSNQKAAITRALQNSLANSFQPSNTPLPNGIVNMRLKTMPPDDPAIAILMNLPGGAYSAALVVGEGIVGVAPASPDPSGVTDVFLKDGDDFAFAVDGDFFTAPFTSAVNSIINNLPQGQIPQQRVFTAGPYNASVRGEFTVEDATIELRDSVFGAIPGGAAADTALASARHGTGDILLTIPIKVHINIHFEGPFSPDDQNLNFEILVSQAFDLNIDNGQVTGLNRLFDLSVSGYSGSGADQVKKLAQDTFNTVWNANQDQINNQVSSLLNTSNLSKFLNPLTQPTTKPGSQPVQNVSMQLAYSSFEIRSTGVILHGTLQVPSWPPAVVEFDPRTYMVSGASVGGRKFFSSGTEYNALKSWIPGGNITEFIWSLSNGSQLLDDTNRFVLPNAQLGVFDHLCLKIKGTRISATDPLVEESVEATVCNWAMQIDTPSGVSGGLIGNDSSAPAGIGPSVALAEFSESGKLDIIGHTSASGNGTTANLIVHFPENESLGDLSFLPKAVEDSERKDTAAAILVVLAPDQVAKVKRVRGVAFTDDSQAWARLLRNEDRPETHLISPDGKIVWHNRERLSPMQLAKALRVHLAPHGFFRSRLLQANLRLGQPTFNFLFEYVPGKELTLRKLIGREVVIVFWRSSSQPSVEAVRDVQQSFRNTRNGSPVILAINDGDTEEVAKRASKDNGLSVIVVPDTRREISSAYGVTVWPTTIFLNGSGLVYGVRYGRFAAELAGRYATQRAG